ncbi:MAG: hypothetical protein M0Z80_06100, partial [Treponema sp.]|nr:hypothetical protein [Treponema sp.]
GPAWSGDARGPSANGSPASDNALGPGSISAAWSDDARGPSADGSPASDDARGGAAGPGAAARPTLRGREVELPPWGWIWIDGTDEGG